VPGLAVAAAGGAQAIVAAARALRSTPRPAGATLVLAGVALAVAWPVRLRGDATGERIRLAEAYQAQGRTMRAVVVYRRALELAPDDPRPRAALRQMGAPVVADPRERRAAEEE
jgi:hypothetical protein